MQWNFKVNEIKWREVTWYSRLLAMVLFIALPFIGFWAGVQYGTIVGPLQVVVRNGGAESAQNIAPSSETALPGREPPKTITAQTVLTVSPNREFLLKALPNTVFRVTNVSRASGAANISSCGGPGIFIPDPSISLGGTCVAESKLRAGSERMGLVVVELEIENLSKTYVNGRFLQLFYNPEKGGDIESKLAVMHPAVDGYGALPLTSRRIVIGFLVPESQEQVQLVYGDYGKAPGFPENQETLLGKSVGGWIVNFSQKSFADIPG